MKEKMSGTGNEKKKERVYTWPVPVNGASITRHRIERLLQSDYYGKYVIEVMYPFELQCENCLRGWQIPIGSVEQIKHVSTKNQNVVLQENRIFLIFV